MPGQDYLAKNLGVGRETIQAALRQLENEGLLKKQGQGRNRLIALPEIMRRPSLRIRILPYTTDDFTMGIIADVILSLRDAGYGCEPERTSLTDLKQDPRRIARLVQRTECDAWIVVAGSRGVLEWFANQPKPSFALFGAMTDLPIAGGGTDFAPALRDAVKQLVALGHHRIVMVANEDHRLPIPGRVARVFLDELGTHGIQTGSYNLPHWTYDPDGFELMMDRLFGHTPPTAMIFDTSAHTIAALQYFCQRGIAAPRDVSIICESESDGYELCKPSVSHFSWDNRKLVRHMIRWADQLSRRKNDRSQIRVRTQLINGGTIGVAPSR